jgi:hypothetical protein
LIRCRDPGRKWSGFGVNELRQAEAGGRNMTEAEWLESTDPTLMLEFLKGKTKQEWEQSKISDRKLRLFIVACCRHIWHSMTERSRNAVEVGERFADGLASQTELAAAEETVKYVAWNARFAFGTDSQAWMAAKAAEIVLRPKVMPWTIDRKGSQSHNYLRDIFGPLPFRPITIDPRWLTSTVVDLATAIYEERVFERMPVLADAFMDAGCDNEQILQHCRTEGPHVRGCWVVDLLLGKS